MDKETLETLRYCIQRVLVPCVVVIGVAGNLLTVVVLTRRRMRCTTNIYLTALALADIVYLLFIFILSLQHYPLIHHPKYKLYWSTIGLSHWFCDASAVVILCFLLTVSTAFEYKLNQELEYTHRTTGKPCTLPNSTTIPNQMSTVLSANRTSVTESNALATTASANATIEQPIRRLIPAAIVSVRNDSQGQNAHDWTNTTHNLNISSGDNQTDDGQCEWVYNIYADQSDLGKNELYKEIFYIFTSAVFTFLPLILLTTFNCFLVATVHRSHKIRRNMTNTRQADTSTAQENKVTVTLIAVVILFLVCQTPAAIQLVYTKNAVEFSNLDRAINNILNFLVTVNAASNFLLYCALSDKYRKTVRSLFCSGRPARNRGLLNSSRYISGRTSTSFFSKSQSNGNFSNASTKTTALCSNRVKPKKRFSITQEDYTNLQAETARLKNPRVSITPEPRKNGEISDAFEEIPLQTVTETPTQLACNHSTNAGRLLKPSGSELSLTRSRSLEFPVHPKHSPHCKENPHHF